MDKSNQYSFSALTGTSVDDWLQQRFQTTLVNAERDTLLSEVQVILKTQFDDYQLNIACNKADSVEAYINSAILRITIGDLHFILEPVWRRIDKHINTMKCVFSNYDSVTGLRHGSESLSSDNYLACAYIWMVVFNNTLEFRYFNNALKALELLSLDSLNNTQRLVVQYLVSAIFVCYHQQIGDA